MQRINIEAPRLDYDETDPEGYRAGLLRLGPMLSALQLGASVYELPPGQSICPYHYEHAEEEWLLVLHGTPTLRHPQGSETLAPWDVVLFPTGPEGAHKLTNDTAEPVRVLMFSSVRLPTVTVYPDSNKIGVWTAETADSMLVRRSSAVGYWDGEAGAGAE